MKKKAQAEGRGRHKLALSCLIGCCVLQGMKWTKDFKAELFVCRWTWRVWNRDREERTRARERETASETHAIYNTYWISFCGSGYSCPRVCSDCSWLQALVTCIIACMEFIESLAPPELSREAARQRQGEGEWRGAKPLAIIERLPSGGIKWAHISLPCERGISLAWGSRGGTRNRSNNCLANRFI